MPNYKPSRPVGARWKRIYGELKTLGEKELPPEQWEIINKELIVISEKIELLQAANSGQSPLDIEINPELLQFFDRAASQYRIQGDYEAAVDIFSLLCYLEPHVEQHWIQCGMAEKDHLALLNAITCFEMAESLNPQNPFALLYAAECYVKMFDRDSAREKLDEAKRRADRFMPGNPDFIAIVGEIEEELRMQERG